MIIIPAVLGLFVGISITTIAIVFVIAINADPAVERVRKQNKRREKLSRERARHRQTMRQIRSA
jgi:hypothetical protein|tara:strand:- start:494 stop:685 length:192 start_codon:yes stop_codon:yes gene_type:complete